jgi:hypothetical protein
MFLTSRLLSLLRRSAGVGAAASTGGRSEVRAELKMSPQKGQSDPTTITIFFAERFTAFERSVSLSCSNATRCLFLAGCLPSLLLSESGSGSLLLLSELWA